MNHPLARVFTLTSVPNALADASECGARARGSSVPDPLPLEYGEGFRMNVRFKTRGGEAGVLRVLWRKEATTGASPPTTSSNRDHKLQVGLALEATRAVSGIIKSSHGAEICHREPARRAGVLRREGGSRIQRTIRRGTEVVVTGAPRKRLVP